MGTISAGRFNGSLPVSFFRGRHGDLFAVQGHGTRPMRWDGVSNYSEDAGMDAPLVAPNVSATGGIQYYVARVDVQDRGACYYQPPVISFQGTLAAGGRSASARAYLQNAGLAEVRMDDTGRGYTSPPAASCSGSFAYGAAASAVRTGDSVSAVNMFNGGTGYLVAPEVELFGGGGSGATATATVSGGRVTSVTLVDGGSGYTSSPTVRFLAGSAEIFPVVRPHLRGTYDCYYRYVDDTPADRGGPIPSNLSPVRVFEAGSGAGAITWSALNSNVRARSHKVELWRTTGNQAAVVYRAATVDVGSTFVDSLTDDELRDPDRTGYAAMPILLPNGELNAMRFGVPPDNMAVAVSFQDRAWYAVDTSGTRPNTLLFSEENEAESVPDINEIILQENVRGSDSITSLVPFGGSMLVMQARHCYRLTFARQPIIDAGVNLLAYRGCLNQRCWDLHDGVAYVMDQFGIYTISPDGQITPISEGIANYFQVFVNYTHARWFTVRFDPKTRILRAFLSLHGDNPGESPGRVLCYSPVVQAWWEERYPSAINAAAGITMASGEYRVLYAGSQANVYALDEGWVDIAEGAISAVVVTEPGAGYLTPPIVRTTGGHGAWLEAAVDDRGRVSAVFVRSPGFGYAWSDSVTISPPDDKDHPSPVQAQARLVPVSSGTSLPTSFAFRSSNMEIATDESPQARNSPRPNDRTITVVHKPTPCNSFLKLRTYFNGSRFPRANVARRDRGVGFMHDDIEPAEVANLKQSQRFKGESTGVQRARFASVSTVDASGSDRHVAIELSGTRGASGDVVIHQVDVEGVAG